MNGVFLRPGDEVELVDTQTGRRQFDVLEDERDFDTSEIERKVTAPDSNRRILEEYLRHAREHEQKYGRFPKTLIFAVNDLPHVSHADELVRILRGLIGRGDEFVAKITGSPTVDRPLQQIRKYRNRDEPAIAVTVDMLTTGVDIPRIEALLFLRPAKSRILFEQMLGRGTRKCLDISKTHFVVFDAVGVLEYFKNASAFTVDPPDKPSRSIADVIAAIDNNQDREYNTRVFVKRLQRIAKEVTSAGRDLFAAYIPAGDIGGFAQRLPDLLEEDLIGTMAVLKNHGFLELLENYPRPPKTFVVATGVEDTVTSAYRFRTADGRELRPTDYIQAFERYVRENPDQIEALSILLKRPRDFDTRALTELRRKLAEAPERFTEPNLRKAYQKELADIIALVRHAALGEPFVLPEERAARALKKVKSGHSFTPPQEQWLRMIQDHLASSLLIEKEQFDTIPFSRHGGWKRANEDFNNKLEPLLPQINYAAIT
jgi:type I restriction enzyme R subunit